MDYAEAIAQIKTLEGGADLVSAIEAEIVDLKGHNSTVIGEKRKLNQTLSRLRARFKEVTDSLGVAVESDDWEDHVKALQEKIGQLQAELTEEREKSTTADGSLGELQQKLDELQSKYDLSSSELTGLRRSQKAAALASKAGASPDVLVDLLGDRVDELTLVPADGDTPEQVMLGDKPLREAIAADSKLSLYSGSIFPKVESESEEEDPKPVLPGGSSKDDPPKSPSESYLNRRYARSKS